MLWYILRELGYACIVHWYLALEPILGSYVVSGCSLAFVPLNCNAVAEFIHLRHSSGVALI